MALSSVPLGSVLSCWPAAARAGQRGIAHSRDHERTARADVAIEGHRRGPRGVQPWSLAVPVALAVTGTTSSVSTSTAGALRPAMPRSSASR
jgi:hypothetical protein